MRQKFYLDRRRSDSEAFIWGASNTVHTFFFERVHVVLA